MPRRGENIYKRKDSRWEGRILKPDGTYRYVYAKTYKEVKDKKKNYQEHVKQKEIKLTSMSENAPDMFEHWLIGIQPITKMPEMPDYISGIINLRGKIIPVMDVRLRFKKTKAEYNDRTCIIVIEFSSMSMGLIVDSVSEVLVIPDKDVSEKPEFNGKASRGYVKSIGKIDKKVILLLNCEKLLNEEELDTVSAQL